MFELRDGIAKHLRDDSGRSEVERSGRKKAGSVEGRMGAIDKVGGKREYDKAERCGHRLCRISITVEPLMVSDSYKAEPFSQPPQPRCPIIDMGH